MDIKIENNRRLRPRHVAYIACGLAVAVSVVWMLTGGSNSALKVSLADVTVSCVEAAEFKDYTRLTGSVKPFSVVQISPEEGGIVMEKVVEEGSHVDKGDVIVRLSNSSLDLQILNAESELAEKQNLLRNTQVAMQQDRLNNETEKVQLDMDTQRKQRAYEQQLRLYGEHLVSREDYQRALEDYEVSQNKHRLISQRLLQDSLYRTVQMEQMEDNLRSMRRSVQMTRERKSRLEVRAPISGELGLLDVELGQSVAAGQMIGQLNDLSNYKIQALVDEHYIDRVSMGLTATCVRPDATYRLTLRKVYPEVRQGRFQTDFVFAGPHPDGIRTGQTYYLDLELGEPSTSVVIPRGAFFQTTGGLWIFVVDRSGTRAYRRSIRIGRQNPQFYEVVEGLEPGERVITSGYEAFKDYSELRLH